MSTLRVNTIQNAGGSGSPEINGLARAWVNFNGTGTVAIRQAFNVTSITDLGTGTYTINFTTALSDANYAVTGTSDPDNSNPWVLTTNTLTTSSCRVFTSRPAVGYADGNVYAAVFR